MALSSASKRHCASTTEKEAYLHLHKTPHIGHNLPVNRKDTEEIRTNCKPVRNSLKRLADDGVVTLRPNRGCVVVGFALDLRRNEVFGICAVLKGIEVSLVISRLTSQTFVEPDSLLLRIKPVGEAGSRDWLLCDRVFQALLYVTSERPNLIHQISALHDAIERCMHIRIDYIDRLPSVREEQQYILNALKSGHGAEVERIMSEHVLLTASRYKTGSGLNIRNNYSTQVWRLHNTWKPLKRRENKRICSPHLARKWTALESKRSATI